MYLITEWLLLNTSRCSMLFGSTVVLKAESYLLNESKGTTKSIEFFEQTAQKQLCPQPYSKCIFFPLFSSSDNLVENQTSVWYQPNLSPEDSWKEAIIDWNNTWKKSCHHNARLPTFSIMEEIILSKGKCTNISEAKSTDWQQAKGKRPPSLLHSWRTDETCLNNYHPCISITANQIFGQCCGYCTRSSRPLGKYTNREFQHRAFKLTMHFSALSPHWNKQTKVSKKPYTTSGQCMFFR